jgi:hypothetical protein
VHRGEDALERTLAAVAVRSGELALALIARIAAIRRIADPFIDINITATLAANPVTPQRRQQAAMAENATRLATAAAIRARFARTRAAVVAAPVPHNRLGQPGQHEATRRLPTWATRHAATATAKQRKSDKRNAKPAGHHGGYFHLLDRGRSFFGTPRRTFPIALAV